MYSCCKASVIGELFLQEREICAKGAHVIQERLTYVL